VNDDREAHESTSVSGVAATNSERATHWDGVHSSRGPTQMSWFQATPAVSLELMDVLGVSPQSAVIDVGGGASLLVDHLLERGFEDVSVLDVSEAALRSARSRATSGAPVTWVRDDVLSWRPERGFDLWHDRAVFHFLTTAADRDAYLRTMRHGLRPGGAMILATFAPDGPDHCSGLPVARYTPAQLADAIGAEFDIVAMRREVHTTPTGAMQPFSWVAGRWRANRVA
jgi:trans-aconitate methyltransferase